jgi:hypothetical protein
LLRQKKKGVRSEPGKRGWGVILKFSWTPSLAFN